MSGKCPAPPHVPISKTDTTPTELVISPTVSYAAPVGNSPWSRLHPCDRHARSLHAGCGRERENRRRRIRRAVHLAAEDGGDFGRQLGERVESGVHLNLGGGCDVGRPGVRGAARVGIFRAMTRFVVLMRLVAGSLPGGVIVVDQRLQIAIFGQNVKLQMPISKVSNPFRGEYDD